ncbi:hypothetical protein Pelo_11312 [Pelomyxa schiedti]|nr:hypothetical protein Pelo_11312 [Pelomyxa schiedti]
MHGGKTHGLGHGVGYVGWGPGFAAYVLVLRLLAALVGLWDSASLLAWRLTLCALGPRAPGLRVHLAPGPSTTTTTPLQQQQHTAAAADGAGASAKSRAEAAAGGGSAEGAKNTLRHVAFIIQQGGGSRDQVLAGAAKLVSHAVGMGVRNVTLWDVQGLLKTHVEKLIECVQPLLQSVPELNHGIVFNTEWKSYELNCATSTVSEQPLDLPPSEATPPEGEQAAKSPTVPELPAPACLIHVTSPSDGKGAIVQATKKLVLIPACDITVKHISNSTIIGHYTMTEPELAIIFDTIHSLPDFFPWHLRFTELFWQPSLQHFCLFDFQHINHLYFTREKRYGK